MISVADPGFSKRGGGENLKSRIVNILFDFFLPKLHEHEKIGLGLGGGGNAHCIFYIFYGKQVRAQFVSMQICIYHGTLNLN